MHDLKSMFWYVRHEKYRTSYQETPRFFTVKTWGYF